jgi:hypothetical protein
VVEPSNGTNTDSYPGYSKSKMEAPDALNDPNKDYYHTTSNQNHVGIGFDHSGMKIHHYHVILSIWLITLVFLRLIAVIMG